MVGHHAEPVTKGRARPLRLKRSRDDDDDDDDDDGDDDDYDEETPGIYPGERTKKKTDRAGDPTHYEGGGDDTAEKYTSIDF